MQTEKKSWLPILAVAGVLFVAIIWLSASAQRCGNIYTDQLADSTELLRKGDTVQAGQFDAAGNVTKPDSGRPYQRVCVVDARSDQYPGFRIAAIVLLLGVLFYAFARPLLRRRQLQQEHASSGYSTRHGYETPEELAKREAAERRQKERGF